MTSEENIIVCAEEHQFWVLSQYIHSIYCVCVCLGTEGERKSRVLGCSGKGGRVNMDVSAAKSVVINVVIA